MKKEYGKTRWEGGKREDENQNEYNERQGALLLKSLWN